MIHFVIPVLNEGPVILELLSELEQEVASNIHLHVVDDGSSDDSFNSLKSYKPKPGNELSVLRLSRNFGHQQAIFAGISNVPDTAEIVVTMDGDFQDRPSDVPRLLQPVKNGFDCAYAVRSSNSGSLVINLLSNVFYRLQAAVVTFEIPRNAGTFSAFSNKMLRAMKQFTEHDCYFPGLRAFVGMNQVGVLVQRGLRRRGKSRVGIGGLFNLGLNGLLSFSSVATRLILSVGLATVFLCVILGGIIVVLRLTGVIQVMGFTSLALLILGLAGIQITFLGILGEFLGKLYIANKNRPRWIVNERIDV